jgi:hypothetical protein
MRYNGYSGKGLCALGGGHTADGLKFVLPHTCTQDRLWLLYVSEESLDTLLVFYFALLRLIMRVLQFTKGLS